MGIGLLLEAHMKKDEPADALDGDQADGNPEGQLDHGGTGSLGSSLAIVAWRWTGDGGRRLAA